MIAFSRPPLRAVRQRSKSMRHDQPAWQAEFLQLLPDICAICAAPFAGWAPNAARKRCRKRWRTRWSPTAASPS